MMIARTLNIMHARLALEARISKKKKKKMTSSSESKGATAPPPPWELYHLPKVDTKKKMEFLSSSSK